MYYSFIFLPPYSSQQPPIVPYDPMAHHSPLSPYTPPLEPRICLSPPTAPHNPYIPSQAPTASHLAIFPPPSHPLIASPQLPRAPHSPSPRPGTALPHTSGTAVLSTRSRAAAASLSVLPGQLRLPPRSPTGRHRRLQRCSARRAAPPTAGPQRSLPRTAPQPMAAGGAAADQ